MCCDATLLIFYFKANLPAGRPQQAFGPLAEMIICERKALMPWVTTRLRICTLPEISTTINVPGAEICASLPSLRP
jgi:hypothetical protein